MADIAGIERNYSEREREREDESMNYERRNVD